MRLNRRVRASALAVTLVFCASGCDFFAEVPSEELGIAVDPVPYLGCYFSPDGAGFLLEASSLSDLGSDFAVPILGYRQIKRYPLVVVDYEIRYDPYEGQLVRGRDLSGFTYRLIDDDPGGAELLLFTIAGRAVRFKKGDCPVREAVARP